MIYKKHTEIRCRLNEIGRITNEARKYARQHIIEKLFARRR